MTATPERERLAKILDDAFASEQARIDAIFDLLPNAPREFRFTVGDLILQMQRELAYRERVYGRLVGEHKMKPEDRDRGFAVVHAWIAMAQTLPLDKTFTVPAP